MTPIKLLKLSLATQCFQASRSLQCSWVNDEDIGVNRCEISGAVLHVIDKLAVFIFHVYCVCRINALALIRY